MTRRSLRLGSAACPLDLAAKPAPTVSDQTAGSEERKRLYHSARWLWARDAFLAEHPLCAPCERRGLIVPASVVDHVDGHQHPDWRACFWDQSRWQACCIDCHAAKSAAELAEWRRAGGAARNLGTFGGGTARGPSRERRSKSPTQGPRT
jgi:hypothetical protein